ncbi:MAG: hypothetical protein Q4D79_00765 [Propionibacteriaceae bacterium]|nr:hypothetical protein [Propionibacteriaceae bacterium]
MNRFRAWAAAKMTTAWEGVLIAVGWLVFLVFPGIELWRLGNVPGRWIGLAALAVFVPIYLRCFADLGVFLDAQGCRAQVRRAAMLLLSSWCWYGPSVSRRSAWSRF